MLEVETAQKQTLMYIINNKRPLVFIFISCFLLINISSYNTCFAQKQEDWHARFWSSSLLPDSLYYVLNYRIRERLSNSNWIDDDPSYPNGIKAVEVKELSFAEPCFDAIFDTLSVCSSPRTLYYKSCFVTLDSGEVYFCVYRDSYNKKELTLLDIENFYSPKLTGAFSKNNMTIYVYGGYPKFVRGTGKHLKKNYKVGKDVLPPLDGEEGFVFQIFDDNHIEFKGTILSG